MRMVFYGNKSRYTPVEPALASGGEGAVYAVQERADRVAKIYHAEKLLASPELEGKITYMVNNPPDDSIMSMVAWPLEVLRDNNHQFIGFLMPKLAKVTELKKVYTYPPSAAMPITGEHKLIIAINICTVISELHKAGYIFGDFNPMNIGVDLKNGHVCFFDTDSYHFTDNAAHTTYRCTVAADGYVAPELIKHCHESGCDYLSAPLPTFTEQTDDFALAIHIFKLLMNGYTPFNGIQESESASQSSPGLGNRAIELDNYCFKAGKKPQSPATPDMSSLPPDLQFLFKRTFVEGSKAPAQRASAEEWKNALMEYRNEMTVCRNNPLHYYYINNRSCPYCAADTRYKSSLSQSSPQFRTNMSGSASQVSFSNPVQIPNHPPRQQAPIQNPTNPYQPNYQQPPKKKSKLKLLGTAALVLVLAVLVLNMCSGGSGKSKKKAVVGINVEELLMPLITGYNNYGYYEPERASTISSFNQNKPEEQYEITATWESHQEGSAYASSSDNFQLVIKKDGEIVDTQALTAYSGETMTNGEVVTTSLSGSSEMYPLTNSKFQVSGLKTTAFDSFDPRDYWTFDLLGKLPGTGLGSTSYLRSLSLSQKEFNLNGKTIQLSLIDDKRSGADYVQPGIQFDVYGADGSLLATGAYRIQEKCVKYYAEQDAYYNLDDFGCSRPKKEPEFNQAVMLNHTGILFSVASIDIQWDIPFFK